MDSGDNPDLGPSLAPDRPRFRPDWRGRTGLLVLAAICLLPYLNALAGGFVFDDQWLVVKHPAVQGPFNPISILSAQYWSGELTGARLWRPVTTISFAMDRQVAGGWPAWFHLINLLLHVAVTLLWVVLIRRLTGREALAFVTGALFAVHPLHTEAVTWVSGRAELLAAGFGLAALNLAFSNRPSVRRLAPVAVLLAVGSKESAATIPLVMLLAHWASRSPRRNPPIGLSLACLIPVAVYLILRRLVVGTWAGPTPDPMDNPMAGLGLWSRLPTVLDCLGRYIVLLIWPARLSVDYSTPVLNVVREATQMLLLGLAGTVGLLVLAIGRRRRPQGWGAGFALLTFALTSNLLIVIGTILAERLTYLPSAGLLLILATGGFALARRIPARILQGLLVVILIAGAGRTWVRNRDYRDDVTLYRAGARATPQSPKMHFNLALGLNLQGRYDEALREGTEALRLNPTSRESRMVIASSLDSLGRGDEAIRFLRDAIAKDPGDRASRRSLISLFERRDQKARADSIAEAGMREDSSYPEWIARAAKGAQDRGDFKMAIRLWRKLIRESPESTDPFLYLAYCLLVTGDATGARDAYADGLKHAPESSAAANGLAWMLLETGGSVEEATRLAEQATARDAVAPYFDTLARAYQVAGRCPDALRAAARAVELDSSSVAYRARLEELRAHCR